MLQTPRRFSHAISAENIRKRGLIPRVCRSVSSVRPVAQTVVMDLLVVVVVVMAVMLGTSADDDSCSIRPVFSSREQSVSFFAKSSWAADEGSIFVRSRHCPVRVRREIEENETKAGSYSTSLRNGSNSKDNNAKKQANSHKKLKGSKRKRKKEKRKRFRKKKKNAPGTTKR